MVKWMQQPPHQATVMWQMALSDIWKTDEELEKNWMIT